MALQVVQLLCPKSKYSRKCPYSMKPQGITIHNTANDASAKNEVSYMNSNNNQVSYHYAVDDVRAVQGIPLNRNAWHAGDGGSGYGNRYTIGIEICYSKSGGEKFDKAERNAAELIARLMIQYGWGTDKLGTKYINTHKSRDGKNCPHRTLKLGMNRFYNMVKEEYAKLKGEKVESKTTSTTTNSTTSTTTSSQITVDGKWGKSTTKRAQKVFGTTVDGIVSNQYSSYKSKNPGLLSETFEWKSKPSKGGSELIKAIQKKVGVTQDGYIGTNTIKAMQKWLGTVQDGCVSNPSSMVKAFQKWLNKQ